MWLKCSIRVAAEISHESQGRGLYGDNDGDAGDLEMAVPDRRRGQVGKNGNQDQPVGDSTRPAAHRPRAEEV